MKSLRFLISFVIQPGREVEAIRCEDGQSQRRNRRRNLCSTTVGFRSVKRRRAIIGLQIEKTLNGLKHLERNWFFTVGILLTSIGFTGKQK